MELSDSFRSTPRTAVAEPPLFPGGTAVSGLSVYPWEAVDGLCGGSPHTHLACTEAYVTVGGRGAVQTLTAAGLTTTPLVPGTVVWFSPGTIHRAINHGDLRVVVVMQNNGLPEAGDAVFTFPPGTLTDPGAYQRAAAPAATEVAARTRRDLAVAGFRRLADQVSGGDVDALTEFYRCAVVLVADRVEEWQRVWAEGPVEAVRETASHLASLRAGRVEYLMGAAVRSEPGPSQQDRAFGMCGRLETHSLR